MSLLISKPPRPAIIYPDSDGQPMAENTQQYEWIVTIKGNLDILFLDRTDVFVAGDLLWYPIEGDPKICTAPDTMVVFGRPKGYRGSYRQWEEGGIAPQVVFEILSPGNRPGKMFEKYTFYDRYGVVEYYVYDPDTNELGGCKREGDRLKPIAETNGWTSPLLGIHLDGSGPELKITYPDGRPFLTFTELGIRERELERERDALAHERNTVVLERDAAVQERDALAHERDAVAQERDAVAQERNAIAAERDRERERAEKLAARLRELGLDPPA